LLSALHFSTLINVASFLFLLCQSQQDLSLDDIDDSCDGDRTRKSRFVKRLRSPDRSVWDISSYLPGGDRKNEIEKMFEKFKIKMAADDEGVDQDNRSKVDVRSMVTAGVSGSDFSPAHNEHSKLIGSINKAYNTSVNDVERAVGCKDTKQDGDKSGKKKHKHKHDKEKKSRHSKSKSKHASESDSTAVESSGMQSTIPSSDDIVFPTVSQQNFIDDDPHSFSHSVASHVAESTELDLPSVHNSCHLENVFTSTPEQANIDDIGSVDMNELDFSTSELLPEVCFCGLVFCWHSVHLMQKPIVLSIAFYAMYCLIFCLYFNAHN